MYINLKNNPENIQGYSLLEHCLDEYCLQKFSDDVECMERHLWQKDYMQIWRRTQIFALENKYLYQDKNIWVL